MLRCAWERSSKVTGDELESRMAAFDSPTLVFLWAEWSRPALELLPTVAELATEYEGAGLEVVTVCLGEEPERDSRRVLHSFPQAVRHLTLVDDPSFTFARHELQDIPAALIFGPGGELLFTLDSSDEAALTPADLADAIEAALQ